jgi:hypothetical protein
VVVSTSKHRGVKVLLVRTNSPNSLEESVMNRLMISRLLVSGLFLVSMMVAVKVTAQTASNPSHGNTTQQPKPNPDKEKQIRANPACVRIINECTKLGFIEGQANKDNGLWLDCFWPVVKETNSTREGRPVKVPVSEAEVNTCRAVAEAP